MSKIETTEEEMEGYNIVLAILRRKLPKTRVVHRKSKRTLKNLVKVFYQFFQKCSLGFLVITNGKPESYR